MQTGDVPRAETQANVYCIIAGDQGDSGKRMLSVSKAGGTLFRRAQVRSPNLLMKSLKFQPVLDDKSKAVMSNDAARLCL